MKTRTLGQLVVSELGFGCLALSGAYGNANDDEGIATIHRAIELGVTLFDTADMYGHGHNEELVGRALRGRRDTVIVATKFGQVRDPNDHTKGWLDGRPQYVREACDASLKRLGLETIDLYYQHRLDPKVPVEESVGAMAELVSAGKVRFLGLCASKAETIRRAHRVHPITAHQAEWSLWMRDPEETGTYATCQELGIGFVPFSPLGRGFFSGNVKVEDIATNDLRFGRPRFSAENMEKNAWIVERLTELAAPLGITPNQLALAWVLARGEDVVPIPSTRRQTHLEQNVAAVDVTLSPQLLAAIDEVVPQEAVAGAPRPSWGT